MATDVDLTFEAIIPCDSVRQEINGKFFLIGVYTSAVVVPQLPTNLPITFFIQFAPTVVGSHEAEFQLIGPHEVRYGGFEISFDVGDSNLPGIVPFPGMRLNVQLPGELKLQYRRSKSDWKTVKTVTVITQKEQDERQKQFEKEIASRH